MYIYIYIYMYTYIHTYIPQHDAQQEEGKREVCKAPYSCVRGKLLQKASAIVVLVFSNFHLKCQGGGEGRRRRMMRRRGGVHRCQKNENMKEW
jgi:hypothetical protein